MTSVYEANIMFIPFLLRVVKYKVTIVEFFVQKSVMKGEKCIGK